MESDIKEFIKNFDLLEHKLCETNLSRPHLFDFILNEEILVGMDLKKVQLIQRGVIDPRSDVDTYLDEFELKQALMRAVKRYLPSISQMFRGISLRHANETLILRVEQYLPSDVVTELLEVCKVLCEHDNVLLELPSKSNQRFAISVRKPDSTLRR